MCIDGSLAPCRTGSVAGGGGGSTVDVVRVFTGVHVSKSPNVAMQKTRLCGFASGSGGSVDGGPCGDNLQICLRSTCPRKETSRHAQFLYAAYV